MRTFLVYIIANHSRTLYVGMTNDLLRRVSEHKQGLIPGFTAAYGAKPLVWFEAHQYVDQAILREKRIKRWRRAWKLELIEALNRQWGHLYAGLLRQGLAPG